jgi:hypothetical protein
MTPSSLLNVPTELLRAHGAHHTHAPMAGSRDRLWAALVCTAFVGLSIALIIVLR